jgi:hypothetical protein
VLLHRARQNLQRQLHDCRPLAAQEQNHD